MYDKINKLELKSWYLFIYLFLEGKRKRKMERYEIIWENYYAFPRGKHESTFHVTIKALKVPTFNYVFIGHRPKKKNYICVWFLRKSAKENVDFWEKRAIWVLSMFYSWGSCSRNWWKWPHCCCYRSFSLSGFSFVFSFPLFLGLFGCWENG